MDINQAMDMYEKLRQESTTFVSTPKTYRINRKN